MFEKGRIGIFGDSLTELGENVNDISKPMIWSQMFKLNHPEYEFLVDAMGGRRMWGNHIHMKGKIRDGSLQLEPFIRNSFPCKKILIFLGTNDIFGGINDPEKGLRNLADFEKDLVKFRNLLFKIIDDIYIENKPQILFATTHKFNFENEARFNKKKLIPFENYGKIKTVFDKLENVKVIDTSNFEVSNEDGVHITMNQQKDFYNLIEETLLRD